jgi:beta-lactam-binding protein with PASTA domain
MIWRLADRKFMPKKKPIDYAFYLLIYFILFFITANLTSQLILRGELIILPDLKGKNLEEARAMLTSKKTTIAIQGRQFDSHYEKGRIISHDPGPGSRIKANRTVNVMISEGNESVSIPKLEGHSLEYANQVLKAAGLRKGRSSQIHTPQYAAGRIIAQMPPASETADRNASVNFLISQGAWENRYIMPDLIEKKAVSVIQQLKAMDFQVAEIHYGYYHGLEPGIIINQSPAHGYRVQKRSQITLEVSK